MMSYEFPFGISVNVFKDANNITRAEIINKDLGEVKQ